MITKVSANDSHWPLLFILIPLLLFMALRNIGVLAIVGFLSPIFQYLSKFFTQYQIKDNRLIIKTLLSKREMALDQIKAIENKKSSFFLQLIWALPNRFQIVKYHAIKNSILLPNNL